MSDLLMPSAFQPPSDPADIPAWLLEQEEEIARITVRALDQIIERSLTAFVSTLTAAGDLSAFDGIPNQWSTFVRSTLSDRLGGLFLSGGVSAWIQSPLTEILPDSTIEAWTSVINEQAVAYSATATNRLTGPVSDSIWNDLKQKVTSAIQTGKSTEALTEEIRLMGEFSRYRAETIARTEANGAYNAGNYQSAQALGDVGPVEKYWISTGDDRTRPSHREADGQTKPFAQPFIIGGSEMLYPHDPAGPAKEVINCRCVVGYLYPGMERPDGSIVPETPNDQQATATVSTQETLAIPVSPYGRGINGTQTFSDLVQIPEGQRGRLGERSVVMKETVSKLNQLHGLPAVTDDIFIRLGGKADLKGGHFTPATRGPRPKRTRGMSVSEWNQKVAEYNSRTPRAEIRINDFDIDKQASDLTHELGHAVDWDGPRGFRSRRAWTSDESKNLLAKYGKDWMDHADEIVDEETRLFVTLGREARNAQSIKDFFSATKAPIDYRQYFTSLEEVWARSYAQWVAEVADDPRLAEAMKKSKDKNFQFSDEEFARIRPLIEGILRVRGLMK